MHLREEKRFSARRGLALQWRTCLPNVWRVGFKNTLLALKLRLQMEGMGEETDSDWASE